MNRRTNPWLSVVVAIATWVSLLPLHGLIEGADHLFGAGASLAMVGAVGLLSGLFKRERLLTFGLQFVAVLGVICWQAMSLAPEVSFFDAMPTLAKEGIATITGATPPLAAAPSITFFIVVLALVMQLIAELLSSVLDQPAWTFAPLFLCYIVASIAAPGELPLWAFAAVAASFVMVLVAATGIGDGHRAASASRTGAFQATRITLAAVLAVAAIACAAALQPLVPVGKKQPWQGTGSGPIQLADPTIELNKNLLRPDEHPVLTYRTGDGEPVYLRTVALPDLTTHGAALTSMKLRSRGLGSAYDAPGRAVNVDVQMRNIPSEYLPVPFAVENFDADGSWAFDPETLAVVATGNNRKQETMGLAYSAQSVVPQPSPEDLDLATAGTDAAPITKVVPDVDAKVTQLTKRVVQGSSTDGQKAQAIQSFLRGETFTYSIDAPQNASLDVISSFLLEDHSGYCIHFASAMMTMARIEGIPSRMAVGFNEGTRTDDGSFEVTSHNMHAWPELYFEGLGWVPFEPTPSVAEPPEYTDPDAPKSPEPSPSASSSSSPSATPSESSQPPVPVPPTPTEAPQPQPTDETSTSSDSPILPVLFTVLGVLLLLAAPWLVRFGLYRWRLRSGQDPSALAEGAWREVRAIFIDAGIAWPDGSPGPVARAAAQSVPDGSALVAVAETVERALFARGGDDVTLLPEQVASLRKAVLGSVSFWRRLVPRSLWHRG
ncbi:MAG: DUF3488 and transglutaminase-like domain-containing protein [Propionibacteriaceae bacterium]|nr:DUF3488 and transglutaminase-like domain-containing protein [Propionibacteriaceae bacterium]